MSIWPRCYSMTWSVRMDQLVLSLIVLFRIASVLGFDENRNDNVSVYTSFKPKALSNGWRT